MVRPKKVIANFKESGHPSLIVGMPGHNRGTFIHEKHLPLVRRHLNEAVHYAQENKHGPVFLATDGPDFLAFMMGRAFKSHLFEGGVRYFDIEDGQYKIRRVRQPSSPTRTIEDA